MEKQQNVREKLVELLYTAEELADKRCDSYPNCDSCPADNKRIDCMDWLKADCLLSLGVTVQDGNDDNVLTKWIPVTERLPEKGLRVLTTDGAFVGEMYLDERGQWRRYNVNSHELLMALDILYWMPMPEPPVGGFALLGC